jgi:hypothetical protein
MTDPSSTPRGEHAGRPGARWETELRSLGEQYVPDGETEPLANRAARRAAARARKPSAAAWRARSASEPPSRFRPESGPQSRHSAPRDEQEPR